MAFLADTQILLWTYGSPEKLSRKAKAALTSVAQPVYFSMASIWEMAIKVSVKKLKLSGSVTEFVRDLQGNGFSMLPITPQHAEVVSGLPFHHRDPFDRILIAQAMAEDLKVITSDGAFDDYDIQRVW